MESLVRLFLAVTKLFEPKGPVPKRQVARLIIAACLDLIIAALVFAGLGLLMFSLFKALAEPPTPEGRVRSASEGKRASGSRIYSRIWPS